MFESADLAPVPTSLDGLIQDSIRNVLSSDKLVAQVERAAEKAVSEAIESAFSWNSPFRKGINEAVLAVLPVVDVTDIANFANAVQVVIRQRLANLADDTVKTHVEPLLDKLFPNAPLITMAELKEAYIEKVKSNLRDSRECHCDDEDDDEEDPEITWEIDYGSSGSTIRNYWDLILAPEAETRRYDPKAVALRFKDLESGLSECWHVSNGGTEQKFGSLFNGPLHGFDAMVFRLATGTAKLQKHPAKVSA